MPYRSNSQEEKTSQNSEALVAFADYTAEDFETTGSLVGDSAAASLGWAAFHTKLCSQTEAECLPRSGDKVTAIKVVFAVVSCITPLQESYSSFKG